MCLISCNKGVLAKEWIFVLLLPFLFSLSACSGKISSQSMRKELYRGQLNMLVDEVEDYYEPGEDFHNALTLARLYQMQGRWEDSIKIFKDAESILEEYESRAIVNIRAMASDLGLFTLARGAKGYFGAAYERSLLHTFNALNYLMLGDVQGAAVEMRKMERRQERWLEESRELLLKNETVSVSAEEFSPSGLPVEYSMRSILEKEEGRKVLSTYQDAFSYTLSALICEMAGDTDYAAVSKKRAEALEPLTAGLLDAPLEKVASRRFAGTHNSSDTAPSAPASGAEPRGRNPDKQEMSRRQIERLAERWNALRYGADWVAALSGGPKEAGPTGSDAGDKFLSAPGSGEDLPAKVGKEHARRAEAGRNVSLHDDGRSQDILVIISTGFAPSLYIERVRTSMPGIGYVMLDLPSLAPPAKIKAPPRILIDGNEVESVPLLLTDALAYRNLWDTISFETAAALARAGLRAASAYTAFAIAYSSKDTRDYSSLIGTLVTVVTDMGTLMFDENVRNWDTLPCCGYLARARAAPGSSFRVVIDAASREVELPEEADMVVLFVSYVNPVEMRIDQVAF